MGAVRSWGWGAGGAAQRAGTAMAVSHGQLSLPGWDRPGHPAPHCARCSHGAAPSSHKTLTLKALSPVYGVSWLWQEPGSLSKRPDQAARGTRFPPPCSPQEAGGALGPSGRSGSAVHSHRLCTHRCHMTTGTQRDGWGWGGAVFAMRGDCRPGAAGQRPGWRPDSTASATVPPIGALVGHPAVPTAQLGHGYRWAAGEMKQKANKVGAGLHPNPMARVIW